VLEHVCTRRAPAKCVRAAKRRPSAGDEAGSGACMRMGEGQAMNGCVPANACAGGDAASSTTVWRANIMGA
jgi:hypothetical protein